MINEQFKILELIAEASDDENVERLLNALIHEASFDDVAQMRAILSDRLMLAKTARVTNNYRKALEFLD